MLDATHPTGRLHSEVLKCMLSVGWQSELGIPVEAFFGDLLQPLTQPDNSTRSRAVRTGEGALVRASRVGRRTRGATSRRCPRIPARFSPDPGGLPCLKHKVLIAGKNYLV